MILHNLFKEYIFYTVTVINTDYNQKEQLKLLYVKHGYILFHILIILLLL